MNLTAARQLLGLVNGYTVADVRAAFVAKVQAAHPDNGGDGKDVNALVEAKDLLLGNHISETSCPQCKGAGIVKGKLGVYDCGRCGGVGTV